MNSSKISAFLENGQMCTLFEFLDQLLFSQIGVFRFYSPISPERVSELSLCAVLGAENCGIQKNPEKHKWLMSGLWDTVRLQHSDSFPRLFDYYQSGASSVSVNQR